MLYLNLTLAKLLLSSPYLTLTSVKLYLNRTPALTLTSVILYLNLTSAKLLLSNPYLTLTSVKLYLNQTPLLTLTSVTAYLTLTLPILTSSKLRRNPNLSNTTPVL